MTVAVRAAAERVARRVAEAAAERRRRREEARDGAERTRVPDRIRPTRQTEQRLQRYPVERLAKRGVLDDACVRAATDICVAYIEAAGVVMTQSQLLAAATRSRRASDHPTIQQIARRERYIAWIEHLHRSGRYGTVFQPTIDIVVEGHSIQSVATRRGWGYKRTCAALVYGLGSYAQIARSRNLRNVQQSA